MKYTSVNISSTQISGSFSLIKGKFTPWLPSTWKEAPSRFDDDFYKDITKIFTKSIIDEIDNVIEDAKRANGSLVHRGHVIAIAQLCAIDTFASYAYFDELAEKCNLCGKSDSKTKKYKKFIIEFFPQEYKQYAELLYKIYRNSMIHSWNLFGAAIKPDNVGPNEDRSGNICYGLLNFQRALKTSLSNFLQRLKTDPQLQENTIRRYSELKRQSNKITL